MDSNLAFSYCGDHIGEGVVYLQGTGGALADMDIVRLIPSISYSSPSKPPQSHPDPILYLMYTQDCDGLQNSPASDGRCGSSTDTQSHTSFEDTVKSYNKGVDGLDAYIHPYVVFGNVGSNPGFVNYDPRKDGVHELGLIAVVCGNGKMVCLPFSILSFAPFDFLSVPYLRSHLRFPIRLLLIRTVLRYLGR